MTGANDAVMIAVTTALADHEVEMDNGRDPGDLAVRVRAALDPFTTDGTHQPSTRVTTAAHLATLPIGSVVLDAHGDAGLIDYSEVVRYAETAPLGFDYVVKHYAPLTVLFRPDVPQPTPTGNSAFPVADDAVERAARAAWEAPPSPVVRWEHVPDATKAVVRVQVRAALAAASAGEAAGRDALVLVLHQAGVARAAALADTVLDLLADRGDATPTVTAEQVDQAVRTVSAADGFEYDPDTATFVVAVLVALGIEVEGGEQL